MLEAAIKSLQKEDRFFWMVYDEVFFMKFHIFETLYFLANDSHYKVRKTGLDSFSITFLHREETHSTDTCTIQIDLVDSFGLFKRIFSSESWQHTDEAEYKAFIDNHFFIFLI